jgi:hypothetical protein
MKSHDGKRGEYSGGASRNGFCDEEREPMNTDEFLDPEGRVWTTLRNLGKIFEAYHVTTFTGYRKAANGEDRKVSIEILDAGAHDREHRYTATVTDVENGRHATGNGAGSVDQALAIIHWQDLDRD